MSDQSIIGVACNPGEEFWVREFFELFKTPWEFYRSDRAYPVVVSTRADLGDVQSKLFVQYAMNRRESFADESGPRENAIFSYQNVVFPVYGDAPIVPAVAETHHGMKVLRVGYNLFEETRYLLSSGQPVRNALTPTLEIHIAILRDWILNAGIPLVEIPPVPAGHEFIACLTHDVDFIRIRDHKFDHTMWGFLYRASIGSLLNWWKGKTSWRCLLKNLKALLSLPLVHLGICKDFWLEDFERFTSLERDLKATFFFIPFKDRPGENVQRTHSNRRLAVYDVSKERGLVQELKRLGNEIGVHGIDAWHDAEKGREERRRIGETAQNQALGTRIHWLCFDASSPRILEEAGFEYDSTFGYNDAVGYRGGTAQVFQPEGTKTLLELPLHIQDSALFYDGYLSLAESEAWKFCEIVLKNASTYGGVVTILFHTRSLAPERLWGDFYRRLLRELRARPVWFATAGQAVDWFRHRRSVSFRSVVFSDQGVRLDFEPDAGLKGAGLTPGLVVRVHSPRRAPDACHGERRFVDIPWTGEPIMNVSVS